MAEEVVPWGHWTADPNMAAPEDDRRHSELASTFREQWAWGGIAAPQQRLVVRSSALAIATGTCNGTDLEMTTCQCQ